MKAGYIKNVLHVLHMEIHKHGRNRHLSLRCWM